MKIVIDIPEDAYRQIRNWGVPTDELRRKIYDIIDNGTPLPEHHGRLGDLDALEAEMINRIKSGNYEEGYEEYAHINNMDDCIECVNYAPTIIEAEGSDKNDE